MANVAPTTTTATDLTIESFAQLVHELERERDEWKREAELQHACCVDAWDQVRDATMDMQRLTSALERALAREEEYKRLLAVRVRLAVPSWPERRRLNAPGQIVHQQHQPQVQIHGASTIQ